MATKQATNIECDGRNGDGSLCPQNEYAIGNATEARQYFEEMGWVFATASNKHFCEAHADQAEK